MSSRSLDLELQPEQPDEVVRAVEGLLAVDEQRPDPWWRAGLDEMLTDA